MVTVEELLACSISNWYPRFAKHTFPTILVPLPQEFVDWLLEDGLFVPPNSSAFPARNKQDAIVTEDDYQDWSSDDDGSEDGPTTSSLDFPTLIAAFEDAITELGGSVVPKLTWSVPKDAIWMAVGNTLRCSTSDQILLLLKSSDRVAYDLSEALAQCKNSSTTTSTSTSTNGTAGKDTSEGTTITDDESGCSTTTSTTPPIGHVLALRKWYDLRPGREFRCFVLDGCLVGISQRDVSLRYEELEVEYESLKTRIEGFYQDVILPGGFGPSNFTYDCYVPSTATSPVRLIDFNPVGGTTAALLFEWDELLLRRSNRSSRREGGNGDIAAAAENTEEEVDAEVDFRIIREDVALRPDTALYGVPYDFVDFSEGSALSALMEQAQQGNIGR